MNAQEKIIAARRIVRLESDKTLIEDLLKSDEVKNQQFITVSYGLSGQVRIKGEAFQLIVEELQRKVNQINQEIYDTPLS